MFINPSILFTLLPLLSTAAPAPFFRFDVVNTTMYSGSRHASPALNSLSGNCSVVVPNEDGGGKRNGCQIVRNCVEEGQVAVTYDDGMYLDYESAISHSFGNDSKSTYFLNGNNFDCIYNHVDQIRALFAAGHTLGSHGWSHRYMDQLSWDEINEELERLEQAFIRILGVRPRLFRPPYGNWNELLLSALSARNYTAMILWDTDVEDGKGASVDAQKGIYDAVAGSYPEPHVVLAHSVHRSSALEVTPYAVDRLRKSGYELVGMDTCMGIDGGCAYEYVGEPQKGDWSC